MDDIKKLLDVIANVYKDKKYPNRHKHIKAILDAFNMSYLAIYKECPSDAILLDSKEYLNYKLRHNNDAQPSNEYRYVDCPECNSTKSIIHRSITSVCCECSKAFKTVENKLVMI